MKRFLLILLVAAFSCGFMLPETCAQRKARERTERAWAKTVVDRYDLPALLEFLRRTVKENKTWQDVDLSKPEIGSEWKIVGTGMASGVWSFGTSDLMNDDFRMSFIYESGGKKFWVTLKCERKGMRDFRLTDVSKEEVVELMM